MPTCYNCPKPAMYEVGPDDQRVQLCLDCYVKLVQAQDIQQAMYERHINYLSDQMDYTVGLPRSGPRFPERPRPTVIQGTTFHNINVTDSSVGVINTGQLHQVDSAITVIGQQGDKQLAQALKSMTEMVLASALQPTAKKEAIELLGTLSQEAAVPQEQRRKSVGRMLAARLQEIIGTAADLATIATYAMPIIAAAFGS